ncbi:cobalamin biosynthesis protein CobQ [Candidatus Nitromaritima sp. SCGC AAA799-C22]|nr:cobalamin biosynthesis protein CobQ [Candidatus Nitromaritima sp. SCGC AAA799-C22]
MANAKSLMIQGTGSGVGKSIITAALCRYFYRNGHRVAPFKAQNMANNSFVTKDGGEMGRAQAYQAEACGIEPQVTMNPILLKPGGDDRSQVIVMGKARDNQNARGYYARFKENRSLVAEAFARLRDEYDLIVMEGAGSPAEINLRNFDLVNMGAAEMANSPVLLVGDIDKGGVFAWLKGTLDLLSPEESDRVRGVIINKFRGDIEILRPGLEQFADLTGKPVLGVIPYGSDLVVDEEDSIPAWQYPATTNGIQPLDVAIAWYPRIANCTDLSPLAYDPAVSMRYVSYPSQLGNPDLIVLPGTKSTLSDLSDLKRRGLASAIIERHRQGSLLLGICGGFQMLGKTLSDPDKIEGDLAREDGLDFFPNETTWQEEKVTRQMRASTISGPVFDAGVMVEGYEIHMGITRFHDGFIPMFEGKENGYPLGICNEEGTVIGSYLHGFLDNDNFRTCFLNHVRQRRNRRAPETPFEYRNFRKRQIDRLEQLVCGALDMNRIDAIVNGS